MLSDRCLSVLSVTFVHCGQTAGRIKMKLGEQVGLGPGHIVLDGDPAPPPPKGHSSPIFGPYLLRPNGSMDQNITWYGARPRQRRLCVRWGPSTAPQKAPEPPLQFSAHFYCGQTAECIKMPLGMDVGLSPGDFVLDGDPVPLPKKGVEPPNFRPMFIVAKRLDGSRWHLARSRPKPRRLCVRWGPSPFPTKGAEPPPNFRSIFIVAKRMDASRCHLVWK